MALANLARMALLCVSPRYAARTAARWWESPRAVTHEDQSESAYDFYAQQIVDLIQPLPGRRICDFGCGDGSIAQRLVARGLDVTCVDQSAALRAAAERRGLHCVSTEEFFTGSDLFDVVFMNEVFFYVHPRHRRGVLKLLRGKLAEGGQVFILDEPDLGKRGRLGAGRIREMVWRVLPVYDVPSAAFFDDPVSTVRRARAVGFRSGRVVDSWSDYRSHIVLGG